MSLNAPKDNLESSENFEADAKKVFPDARDFQDASDSGSIASSFKTTIRGGERKIVFGFYHNYNENPDYKPTFFADCHDINGIRCTNKTGALDALGELKKKILSPDLIGHYPQKSY